MNLRILTAVILTAIVVISCEKEEDGKNSHRIKEIVFDYAEGNDRKTVFSYEGSKLISVVHSSRSDMGIWEEYFKAEMVYFSGTTTNTYSRKESGGSWNVEGKSDYIVEGGLMLEEANYDYTDFSWELDWKWNYQYSGTDLVSWQGYYPNEYGTPVLEQKGDYYYNSGKLSEFLRQDKDESGSWQAEFKEDFNYSGDLLTGWTSYYPGETLWDVSGKGEYTYDGDKISRVEYFSWDASINRWKSSPYYTIDYTFDKNGYMTETQDDDGDITSYTYEEGHGNAEYFWYYPANMVYQYPRLKSSGESDEFRRVPWHERIRTR